MAQLPCSPRYGFLCLFVFQDIYQSKAAFLLSECVTKDGLITAVLQCLERVTVGDMCTHEHARTCARVHTHTHLLLLPPLHLVHYGHWGGSDRVLMFWVW